MENIVKAECFRVGAYAVKEYEDLGSTNTWVEGVPSEELRDRMVVVARKQTQGRGQEGNKWESEAGKNIAMTVVWKPEGLEAGRQFAVSMAVALGCRDFLARRVEGVTVKWPNDIYVGDKKIAGILIEHRIVGACVGVSLCGIGLNVNQRVFRSDAPNPVSLWQLTGRELLLAQVLEELLECLEERYLQVHDYGQLEKDFLSCLYRKEGVYDWKDEGGMFRASIEGLDEYGQLCLRDTEGRRRVYAFKEVTYV